VVRAACEAEDVTRAFDELVAEAESVSVDGWDFSWLAGRATERRPSWGYARSMGERIARASAALDVQTGGGEVLASVPAFPPLTVATESWPPNIAQATALLHPLGVAVVADPDEPPLPFADEAFDFVTSRHPATLWWAEIARVLRPGGTYFAQHVGPHSVFEVVEFFLGPQPPEIRRKRHPDDDVAAAQAAGLEVVDLRYEELRTEFYDIGAVVYFLRKVIWMVPGFSVAQYRPQLAAMHQHIARHGRFLAHSTRFLIEARKPGQLRPQTSSVGRVAPTHLLMDLAGVLAAFDHGPRLAALGRLSRLTEDEVQARLYDSGFVDAADGGELDADGVRAGIIERLELNCPPEEVSAAWMAAFAEDAAALAVLDTVRPPAVVGLLSNNDALVGALLEEYLPGVVARCDAILVAGVLGAQKPAEGAYIRALEELGATAERCLFVDDNQDNVDGGHAAGIDSVRYTSPEQLARELSARGMKAR